MYTRQMRSLVVVRAVPHVDVYPHSALRALYSTSSTLHSRAVDVDPRALMYSSAGYIAVASQLCAARRVGVVG
jgi:hypothetical protein